MIQESILHLSPSYSCLYPLEKQRRNWFSGTFRHEDLVVTAAATRKPSPRNSPPVSSWAHHHALSPGPPPSPPPVDEVHLDIERIPLDRTTTYYVALKGRDIHDHADARRVHFHEQVPVILIPGHQQYPDEMKNQIWTSSEEIRSNVIRYEMQQTFQSDQQDDVASNKMEETAAGALEFQPLRRMGAVFGDKTSETPPSAQKRRQAYHRKLCMP